MIITFFVPGMPQTGGSKRAFAHKVNGRYTGRVIVTDANTRSRTWRGDIRDALQREYTGPPLEGPLALRVTFYLPRPQSHFRRNGALKDSAPSAAIGRCDLTKYLRALEDALNRILWVDDRYIVLQTAEKRYADNNERIGCQVSVTTVQPRKGKEVRSNERTTQARRSLVRGGRGL